MVRISKQAERRSTSHRKHRAPAQKTGSLKDKLEKGYHKRPNALSGDIAELAYIPKIK